jgi:hypothetical protein
MRNSIPFRNISRIKKVLCHNKMFLIKLYLFSCALISVGVASCVPQRESKRPEYSGKEALQRFKEGKPMDRHGVS